MARKVIVFPFSTAGKIATLEHQTIEFIFLEDHLLDPITSIPDNFLLSFQYKKFWLKLYYLTCALIVLLFSCQANKEFEESQGLICK